MRVKSKALLVLAAAALALGSWAALAGAGSQRSVVMQVAPSLTIAASFTNGSPTGTLTVQRACSVSGTATFNVAAAGTVNSSIMSAGDDCIVTATATDGATSVSYTCTSTGANVVCAVVPANNEAIALTGGGGDSATITVIFDFLQPAVPLVVAPAFTG